MSFGSNISSLKAIRRLAENSSSLSQTFERLSSGLRINRASDDAAGLAVSTSLNVDRRVYGQGVRNLNDGLSLLNIADSTLANASLVVARLSELATQASTGTLGNSQRRSLDAEAQALKAEFLRITQSASFNGIQMFDGSLQGLRLQGGYGLDGGIFSRLGGAKWDGTFKGFTSVGSNSGGTRVVSGDLNGDGFSDLVNLLSTGVAVRFGNGDGTFATETTYNMGYTSSGAVALGDFNGDGILDIAAGGANAGAAIYGVRINNGDGTFGTISTFSGGGSNVNSITIADLNRDGVSDLLVGFQSVGPTKAVYQFGNGNGTFSSSVSISNVGGLLGVTDIQVGDVNGDGIQDLLVTGLGDQKVLFGNSSFDYSTTSFFALDYGSGGMARLADLNGDGKLDVITGSGSNVVIGLGNGDGTFQAARTYAAGGSVSRIQIADFDGDGRLDVVTSTPSSAHFFMGNGNGTLGDSSIFETHASGAETGITLGDFDNDGVLDLVASQNLGTNIRLSGTKDGVNAILDFSLQNLAEAKQALSLFKNLSDRISAQRGVIGAFQSRINVASSVLTVSGEQFAAAESRIRDIDVASESAELVRRSILQQAAVAVLSQANLQPALSVRLLTN